MIYTALILGLGGSLHCLGMCGPIALTLSYGKGLKGATASVLYNSGRIITYMVLGLLFGLAGNGIKMAVVQNSVSMAAGGVLILAGVAGIVGWKWGWAYRNIGAAVRKPMGRLFRNRTMTAMVGIGALNGLLPCGLVYMAAIGSLTLHEPVAGMLFMFLFGIGTLPVMLAVGFLRERIADNTRNKMRRFAPIVTMITGTLFLVRGMELGIPYVSPKTSKMEIQLHSAGAGDLAGSMVVCH
jgi:hypothetical protein